MTCWPGPKRLSESMRGGLPACNLSEHRSYRHSHAADIAFAENITRHDFTGRKDVRGRGAIRHDDSSPLVDLQPKVGERHAGPERVTPEWRRVERLGPMALAWRDPFGVAIVQQLMI